MDSITIVGLCAAGCTTMAFMPQAIQAFKTKRTGDVSLVMYIVMTLGIALWLIYGILRKDTPLVIANSLTLMLVANVLILKIRYG